MGWVQGDVNMQRIYRLSEWVEYSYIIYSLAWDYMSDIFLPSCIKTSL